MEEFYRIPLIENEHRIKQAANGAPDVLSTKEQ
jgi:hypothetical protein